MACTDCWGVTHLAPEANQIRPIAQFYGLGASPVRSGAYEGAIGRTLGALAPPVSATRLRQPAPSRSPVYYMLATRQRGAQGLGNTAQDICRGAGAAGSIVGMVGQMSSTPQVQECREQCIEKLTGTARTVCLAQCGGSSTSVWAAVEQIGNVLTSLCSDPATQQSPQAQAQIEEYQRQLAEYQARIAADEARRAAEADTWIPGVSNNVVLIGGVAVAAALLLTRGKK